MANEPSNYWISQPNYSTLRSKICERLVADARAETVREIVGKLRQRADSFKRLRSLVTGMVARELEKQADELEAGRRE